MDVGVFTYRPAMRNPPQERWCCNGQAGAAAVSPPTRNARPLQGGPGIFACGCQGGITHYTLPPRRRQGVRPGTPRDPILRLRTRIQRALAGPAVFGPLPPFLPPVDRGWGRYPPRRQKPACGLAAGDVGLETGTIRSCPKDRHPRDGPPHCPFRFPSTGYTGAGVKIKNRGRNREHHGGDTARRGYFFSSLTLKSVNLRPRSFDYGSLCT